MKHPLIKSSSICHYELIFSRNSALFQNTSVHHYHRKIAYLDPILNHSHTVRTFTTSYYNIHFNIMQSMSSYHKLPSAFRFVYAIIYPILDCRGTFYLRETSENGRCNDKNVWIRIYSRCVDTVR
jgi:hypothetical protein